VFLVYLAILLLAGLAILDGLLRLDVHTIEPTFARAPMPAAAWRASTEGREADAAAFPSGARASSIWLTSSWVGAGAAGRGGLARVSGRYAAAKASFSARFLTPLRWSRPITKSAGTTPSQPMSVHHRGAVSHRERKW
jgi:hypothetical protein